MLLFFVSIVCALNIQLYDSAISWSGNFDNFPSSWNVKISNPELLSLVNDPLDPSVKVIKIKHPKGSCSSFCGITNGASFTMKPFSNLKAENGTFEFSVFFHSTFNFVKGGKLPGMIGGTNQCSGCNTVISERDNCFSARFMWGDNGKGYPYLYLPLSVTHEKPFCDLASQCTGNCGWAFNKTQYFERNKWTRIKQNIRLNTPGKNDGVMQVWVDGVKKIYYSKMNFRTKNSIGVEGFVVGPFFGGSDYSWATPVDTYTMYKDFKFWTVD